MRPLSLERPKPLIPTLDVSQLAWMLAALRWAGVERTWVNANERPEEIRREAVSAGRLLGLELRMCFEPRSPLGTAGTLRRLARYLTSTFVVANADLATDAPVGKLVDLHRKMKAAATLLAVPARRRADMVIEARRVLHLVDRRTSDRPGHHYGGIGVFEPSVLSHIPDGPAGLYETVLTGMMREGAPVAALAWPGYWRDVGSPEAHLAANLDALAGTFDGRGIPDFLLDGWLRWDGDAYVGESARCEGALLEKTVVGRGARVDARARLRRCVVWDGAPVPEGEHEDTVFTPRAQLRLGGEPGPGTA